MMKATKERQQGLSMMGFLVTAIILIAIAVLAMKMVPAYTQDGTIKEVFNAVAHDPALKGATTRDIEIAYVKRAAVQDINAIKPDDIDIENDDNGISLRATYQVKIPLVANISLLLDFNPSSS